MKLKINNKFKKCRKIIGLKKLKYKNIKIKKKKN